jgi:hypothetical protein
MNKTQERALKWLREQGHKDILIKQSSPCFFVKDKKFDVKRLYGNQIIFYNNQYLQLKKHPETTILILRDNEQEPYLKINFKEIESLPKSHKGIEINWVDIENKVKTIRVSEKTKERLQSYGKMGEDFDQLLNRILNKIKNE